jgi:hypothetical protein
LGSLRPGKTASVQSKTQQKVKNRETLDLAANPLPPQTARYIRYNLYLFLCPKMTE